MQQWAVKRPAYVDIILILLGTGLMSVAINNIYDPGGLVTGGFTGIAIIAKEIVRIPLWLTNLVLNIPVFLIAAKVKGLSFIKRSLLATAALSAWLYVLPAQPFISDDFVLISIFGGVLTGVGIGMVFLAKATTGGTDMMAAIIQRYLKHYSIAQIMLVIDAAVVAAGAFVFGISKVLYAVIAIFVVTRLSDGIIEGMHYSKVAYVITKHQAKVAEAIMEGLQRGVTGLNATGMYSGEHRNLLFCVVSKKEIVTLKELVAAQDPEAFVIVSDAREVLGEGFATFENE